MWFKKLNNLLMRTYSNNGRTYGAIAFGRDSDGKYKVLGAEADFVLDSSFTNGVLSNYGKGSIVMRTAGGVSVVDSDGRWQSITASTVSPSVSPSGSASPSASRSPSASVSPSVSPSASASPSASESPSVSPSASASPST
jgi:hypothetical protein